MCICTWLQMYLLYGPSLQRTLGSTQSSAVSLLPPLWRATPCLLIERERERGIKKLTWIAQHTGQYVEYSEEMNLWVFLWFLPMKKDRHALPSAFRLRYSCFRWIKFYARRQTKPPQKESTCITYLHTAHARPYACSYPVSARASIRMCIYTRI